MAIFFKRTDAKLGKLIAAGTVFVAVMMLVDGYLIGGAITGAAGVGLWTLTSPTNSAPVSLALKLLWGVLVFVAFLFV